MDFDESFWVAISTIFCFLAIVKYSKNSLKQFFEHKYRSIASKLDEANMLATEAEKLFDQQKQLNNSLAVELDNIASTARKEIAILKQKAEGVLSEKLKIKNHVMKSHIKNKEDKFISDFNFKLVKLSVDANIAILQKVKNSFTNPYLVLDRHSDLLRVHFY
jgi:F0F1-type ATP synthase membrane subunit b/b'